ncbi:MAG: DNA topoisomerase VI subunit B [Halodesulfurarchaeum sp.]
MTPDQELQIRHDETVETVPIGTLCDAYLPQEGAATQPIPDDIEVPSFNRKTQETTWQPVTHAIRHETAAETYEITTEKGRSVEVTGNHSLFSLGADGEISEVEAGQLEPGDYVLAPKQIPQTDRTVEEINLLEHIDRDQLDGRRVYVYGFDEETLAEIRSGETIRKKPNPDSSRKRYYYRYEGVDILRDSLEQNYIEKGYLPAETVLELGWERKAADCTFKTYRVGGEETTMSVTVPVDDSFVKLLGYYISEGHTGDRQVGFTFGSHESTLIESTETAVATLTGSSTTVERERNSTRVKAFGSPLAMFLEATCGTQAAEKQIPTFVFDLDPALQKRFIAALYEGDGSDSHPSNELSHTTTSETLARQLSVLWNMQGVLASVEEGKNSGYTAEPSMRYRTKVYGEDASLLDVFETSDRTGQQQYKRIPVSVLDPVRVDESPIKTVPDTIPGLLVAAGIGSNFDYAEQYQSVIEEAIAGERVEAPRFAHNLEQWGLLEDGRATDRLRELWEAVNAVHGFTKGDLSLLKVKSVEQTDPPEYVYDISVPGATGADENFVVANDGALSVKNSRGQQGIGISAAVLYAQLTSGKPAKITSRTEGQDEARYFELVIDTDDNEPEIRKESTTTWDRSHGTRIELNMEANMRARSQLHDYIKHTAVVNPHARIELVEPDGHIKSERAEGATLPAETEEIRPHPHGVEIGTLLKMLASTDSRTVRGFLQTAFTRVGQKTADDIIAAFGDREFGRQFRWHPPQDHEDVNLARVVVEAVTNKGRDLERRFGDTLAERVRAAAPVSYEELRDLVDDVADELAEESGRTFGSTVRAKVQDGAWDAITNDRRGHLYRTVDAVTTTRKDDAAIDALAQRLAERIADVERDQFTRKELIKAVDRAADLTEEMDDETFGETARKNIVEALWDGMARVEGTLPKPTDLADDRDGASNLLDGMASVDVMAPPSNCLSPITAEQIEAGLRSEFDAEFYTAATRDADVHSGDPFIAEAGIAYGGDLEEGSAADLMRFANRVPLVYQRGACAMTDVVKGINWRNYGLDQPGGSGIPQGPVVIMIHVASTNVPFTSESKDALANVPEIEDELELALREAARDLKSHLNRRETMRKRRQKQNVIADILPTMAEKVSSITEREPVDVSDSLARIMNNVLVEREREDGTVRLQVENHGSTNADLEITEILSEEPTDLSDGSVVEMDGEYFLTWKPVVAGGDEATLEYEVSGDAAFDLQVSGIEETKLTVEQ